MNQYPNLSLQTMGGLVSGQLSLLRDDPDQTANMNRCFCGIHGLLVPQSSGLASVNAIGFTTWDDPQSSTAPELSDNTSTAENQKFPDNRLVLLTGAWLTTQLEGPGCVSLNCLLDVAWLIKHSS
jgi:hypothetical protein